MTIFKKGLVSILLTLTTLSASSHALANTTATGSIPDCSDPSKVFPNSWLLLVNERNEADRTSLLALLRALSTGGFTVFGIYPAGVENESFSIITQFDPSYYGDEQTANVARDLALQGLAKANDVTIHCNGKNIPYPGITIRN